ncbi:hypothetical protein ACTXT7_004462 [Hymenolepis weldensis]
MPKRGVVAPEGGISKHAKLDEIEKENNDEASQLINTKFFLKCPSDLFDFYQFCRSVSSDAPLDALFHETGLRLVGPFEVLANKDCCSKYDNLVDYYRYFHDPPEFVTILTEDGEHPFHIGYFRDDYTEVPRLLASSNRQESGKLAIVGGDIFTAVLERLEQNKQKKSDIYQKMITFVKENKVTLVKKNAIKRKPTCKTLNEVGIEIKLRGDIGYRPVNATNDDLIIALDNATKAEKPNSVKLDELMTFVQFANDEGDYGQGLELGLDLLAYHPSMKTPDESFEKAGRLNRRITCLLSMGYRLAGLPKFAEVIRKHMETRSQVKRLRKIDIK